MGFDQRSHFELLRPVVPLLPWQSYFLAFVLGLLSFKFPIPALVALVVFAVADTVIRGWMHRLPMLAFIFCAAFGFGYVAQRAPESVDIPVWMEERVPVVIHGTVDDVVPRPGGKLRLILRDLSYEKGGEIHQLSGRLVWNWRKPNYDPLPNQRVAAKLRVVPVKSFGNPGSWDYQWYWQRQGVLWRAWPNGKKSGIEWGEKPDSLLGALKSDLRREVAKELPNTQGGAMVLALVTGDRSELSNETTNATRAAGLAHTLALSGLHVGFVAAMGLGLAWGIGWLRPSLLLSVPRPKLAVCLAIPMVIGYALLGQPSQSLIRAAIMFVFWGLLLLQGRGRILLDGLFCALAVILFWSPLSVFDLSLQMSAVAVLGITIFFPLIRPFFYFGHICWARLFGRACGLLGVSLCANIALMPLVSYTFGTLSPNILLNLIWLPALGFIVMPLGLAGMLFSLASWTLPFASVLLGGAAWVMDCLLLLLHWCDAAGLIPIYSVLRPLWPEVLGFVLLVTTAVLAWGNRRCFAGLAGLGFMLLVLPHVVIMVSDSKNEIRLSLIDVGMGQSALVSTPGGHRWLVDAGGGSSTFDLGEAVVAPYLTYGRPPRLDGIIMSHPDMDHSHGIPFLLSRFEVSEFYTNGMMPRGRTGKRMRAVFQEKVISPVVLRAGQQIELGADTVFEVIHPAVGFKDTHANERSLVLRLVHDGQGLALIPGDVEKAGARGALEGGMDLSSEILVLPHHGSRSTFVPKFYRAVDADAGLCSSGYLNRYGFPHTEVVDAVGVPVFDTASHGQITVTWDSESQLSIRAFWP